MKITCFVLALLSATTVLAQNHRVLLSFDGRNPKAEMAEFKHLIGGLAITEITPQITVRKVKMDLEKLGRREQTISLTRAIRYNSHCQLLAKENEIPEQSEDVKSCMEKSARSADAFNFGSWVEHAKQYGFINLSGLGFSAKIVGLTADQATLVEKAATAMNTKRHPDRAVEYVTVPKLN